MKNALMALAVAAGALAADSSLVEGNPNSSVRVIVYEDLQCSDCATFRTMLDKQILPKYSKQIAVEHRDFPLLKHKWARQAAIAARYFQTIKPALAIEWRQYAMANQRDITTENFNDRLSAWAKQHVADPAKAAAALNDPALAAAVESEYQEGVARGIARTPTVLVNDEPFIETFTFEEISKGIDKAIRGGK
jgi:protein-disulfide isomerase